MQTVSLFDAKTHLSRLVESLATGEQDEIVISRNGKAVVRVLPVQPDVSRRIGIARGQFEVPDDIDQNNAAIALLFTHGELNAPAT